MHTARQWSFLLALSSFGCGSGGSSPAADAGTDAAVVCGPTAAPGSTECPPECTGGCDADNVCTIECSGLATCSGDHIVCPPDYSCVVRCIGRDACDSGRIACPGEYPCTIICDETDGCGDQSVTCGRGPCTVQCGAAPSSCTGMNVHCGPGPCSATCEGTSAPYELIGCEDSCSCTECEGDGDVDAGTDGGAATACDPNPCTEPHRTVCRADGDEATCSCDIGYSDDGAGGCVESADATFEDVTAWVDDYRAEHPGREGDINALSPEEVAEDPEAQRLLALCGPDQRPVIPLLAWEYGGGDHAWIDPEVSALVYCVYTPVDPGTEHWTFAGGHVTADVYVLFPDHNPCGDMEGAEQVAGCIGDDSNFEILVDTASYDDGHEVGLELSEASTELRLLPPDGGPPIHLWDDV